MTMGSFFKNQKGYSLIELVLVLSLVGILSVYAMPDDPGQGSIIVDGAARKVMADMRYAQSLAMTTSTPHGVRGTGANTYQVYNVTTNTPVNSPFHQTPMNEDLSADFSSTTFQNPAFQVIFDASGRPTTGGGTNVRLDNTNAARMIQIANSSGFISMSVVN